MGLIKPFLLGPNYWFKTFKLQIIQFKTKQVGLTEQPYCRKRVILDPIILIKIKLLFREEFEP